MGFYNSLNWDIVKDVSSEKTSKVIYLDQKDWIDIARIYYGESSGQEMKLVEKVLEASEKGQAIFPLSISHLDETMRISNTKRKNRLASLMVKISKGYSFQPYVDPIIGAEVKNIVLRKLGLPTLNIRDYVLGQGISHLLGATPEFVPRNETKSSELPEDIKKKLLDLLESPETMEFALKQRKPKSIDQINRSYVERMEKIRKELSGIKDNDLRHRTFLARNMFEMVAPKLAKILYESSLPKDFIIKEKSTREDINKLLDNIPTALCLFTLVYQRDQQLQRPIKANDFNDIWFLTLAIPYSDIVITDKMFASLSRRAKLDRKCSTIILKSISELGERL